MAASSISREWMDWVGELARGKAPASELRPDPDRFACFLEDQPATLVPRRFLREQSDPHEVPNDDCDVILNPACHLLRPGEITEELEGTDEWRNGFALSASATAWVLDQSRKQWRPFWLKDNLAERLAAARRSGLAAGALTSHERELLLAACVLTAQSQEKQDAQLWETAARRGREKFQQNRYCTVNCLLHAFHLGELRRYYRRLIRHGQVKLGDYQSERRYVAHNEPVARFFHQQLAGAVEQFTGEPVKPSYVYFASYQSGARLERHTDREQCEFSVSFCLDYAPEPEGATPWPLHLETADGQITVRQALGDALLYRGRELPHWRDPLPGGHTSTSIFFHYVPASFSGSLT